MVKVLPVQDRELQGKCGNSEDPYVTQRPLVGYPRAKWREKRLWTSRLGPDFDGWSIYICTALEEFEMKYAFGDEIKCFGRGLARNVLETSASAGATRVHFRILSMD